MKCMNCGYEVAEGAKFCSHCGEKVAAQAAAEPMSNVPIYQTEIKGVLKSGKLLVYSDRTEFVTSSVQKSVFRYSALMAVKKGMDRIVFVMEDGNTENCVVGRKNVPEAGFYIEQAFKPYLEKRRNLLLSRGIRYSFLSGTMPGINSGILNILSDRVEFQAKSGQSEVISYRNVKAAGISSMGLLEIFLLDGKSKSYTVEKEMRDEVLSFVNEALEPYLAERKEALLAMGIYYSCLSGSGSDNGTLNVMEDKVEYRSRTGQIREIFYRDVRAVSLSSMGVLDLALTDGTSASFSVEKDVRDSVFTFVENRVRPYVLERTVGFDTVFGVDEQIRINESRGVFRILRQGGNVISEEWPLSDIVRCEQIESSEPGSMLGGVLSGSKALFSGAAGAVGVQNAAVGSENISYTGVLLSIRTGEEEPRTECLKFGDFSLGMSRTNKKYERYLTEVSSFMDYLEAGFADCELVRPEPVPEPALLEMKEELPAIAENTAPVEAQLPENMEEEDRFGIIKYIEAVAGYIEDCLTPMTIAIQGSWGSGQNSIMKMISGRVEKTYTGNVIWFNTWQFAQFDLGEQLPMLVGNRLIALLSGSDSATNDRAVKVAKGVINIFSGLISQGSTDGQNLTDALFKDNSMDSLEKVVRIFSEQVGKRIAGENDKVVIFVDDLEGLAPVKGYELLEALRNFFGCKNCVFVIAADYDFVLSGIREKYGQEFEESRGKGILDKLFQIPFRVPVSGYNIQNYVKEQLEKTGISTDDETELGFYVSLIETSIGSEPEGMNRLFNSFLLLKRMAEEEIYGSKSRRLMLFALLCMAARFNELYHLLVKMKDKVTPEFLLEFGNPEADVLNHTWPDEDEKKDFYEYAKVLCDIIDTDRNDGISELESSEFTKVLEFSSITAK